MAVLVDSNVLLDVLTEDRRWFSWSSDALAREAENDVVAINPIIYAEVTIGFERIEDLDAALPPSCAAPAAALAGGVSTGKCFVAYRRKGSARVAPLPDFYIGAHARVSGMRLLTRDATRYRTYFPKLAVIAP